MDTRMAVVMRTLEALDLPFEIETVDQRKHIQKAIYLAQVAGIPLDYDYSWYVMGPYSPELTRDYYGENSDVLNLQLSSEPQLRDDLRETLVNLKEILARRKPKDLSDSAWMELVASLHFLNKRRRLAPEATKDFLKVRKPHVAQYCESAEKVLAELDLQ
jgi:uncharacterized protein YwgA